jgi:hypothetical protein
MTPPLSSPPPPLVPSPEYGGLHFSQQGDTENPLGTEIVFGEKWRLKMTRPDGGNLQMGEVTELFVVLGDDWS